MKVEWYLYGKCINHFEYNIEKNRVITVNQYVQLSNQYHVHVLSYLSWNINNINTSCTCKYCLKNQMKYRILQGFSGLKTCTEIPSNRSYMSKVHMYFALSKCNVCLNCFSFLLRILGDVFHRILKKWNALWKKNKIPKILVQN